MANPGRFFGVFSLFFVCSAIAADDDLRVGLAAVDITPPVGWRLADNYFEHISTGVCDPLFAKAIVWRQGNRSAAVVVCDLTGMARSVSDQARDLASQKTDIPRSATTISVTHTHGAPLIHDDFRRRFWNERAVKKHGADPHEAIDYNRQLAEKIAEAIVQANASARPCRLRMGIADQPGLAFNRRFFMKSGPVRFNPGKGNPDIVRPAGPVDPQYHLMVVDDLATEKPIGVFSLFAMHVATFGDGRFGADFPGHLQANLRKSLGNSFVSIFGEGCAGDINHVDVKSTTPQTSAVEPARIGEVLATTFVKALPNLKPSKPLLGVASRTIWVELREAPAEQVQKSRRLFEASDQPAADFLAVVEADRQVNLDWMRQKHAGKWPIEILVIRLSADAALVCLPHEVFVELGLSIKRQSPFGNTFVMSMCNDEDFYVPTRKAYDEGSYEVTNARFVAGSGEQMVESAVQLLRGLASE